MKWPNFLLPLAEFVQPAVPRKPARRPAAPRPQQEEAERSIALAGRQVDYKLVRRRGRRGVSLKVDGNGLTVAASLTAPLGTIEGVIDSNAGWVIRKLGEWAHRQIKPQQWITGARLSWLGESLTLMVIPEARANEVELAQGHLFVRVRKPALDPGLAHEVERAVIAWYRKQALPHLAHRVFVFARLHNLTPPRVMLSSANSRWGSCNSRREVRLSWRLMKARPALIDYVVCHELAHLRHMNHSPQFWDEVARMCPDHISLKAELDRLDHEYRAF